MQRTRSIPPVVLTVVLPIVLVVLAGTLLGACARDGKNADATPTEFCRLVKAQGSRLADLSGTREEVEGAAADVKDLVDASPAEIRDDLDLLADGYRQAADGNFAELAPKAARLQAAITHLVRYTQNVCNVDLNPR